jgi:hypothetical protein
MAHIHGLSGKMLRHECVRGPEFDVILDQLPTYSAHHWPSIVMWAQGNIAPLSAGPARPTLLCLFGFCVVVPSACMHDLLLQFWAPQSKK